jgi:hypothetical protein
MYVYQPSHLGTAISRPKGFGLRHRGICPVSGVLSTTRLQAASAVRPFDDVCRDWNDRESTTGWLAVKF